MALTLFQRFLDHCQGTEDTFFCRRTDWANWIWHWVSCVFEPRTLSEPKAKLRDITEQHSVNQSFCDSLPSTVQTRAVFDDVGNQLNGTGWCKRRKDCVVVHRCWEQWNCKPAVQCKCCNKQQLVMSVQCDAATSPAQLVKESFLLRKQSKGTSSSGNQHFSYLHFHEISPLLFLH